MLYAMRYGGFVMVPWLVKEILPRCWNCIAGISLKASAREENRFRHQFVLRSGGGTGGLACSTWKRWEETVGRRWSGLAVNL